MSGAYSSNTTPGILVGARGQGFLYGFGHGAQGLSGSLTPSGARVQDAALVAVALGILARA